MRLAASMVVRNEVDRYLTLVVEHLREFCDQITILDDHSTDDTLPWLKSQTDQQLQVIHSFPHTFDEHEGVVRQELLEATLERKPTHVLAVDADEFVHDGHRLRELLEGDPVTQAWTLTMTEVWNATDETLQIRSDGAWRPYDRVHLWTVPTNPPRREGSLWKIPSKKLACPPIPLGAIRAGSRQSCQRIYHFGWADPSNRQARYDRYMRLDAGRYHSRTHLASIMWPPERIGLQDMPWPDARWAGALRGQLVAA